MQQSYGGEVFVRYVMPDLSRVQERPHHRPRQRRPEPRVPVRAARRHRSPVPPLLQLGRGLRRAQRSLLSHSGAILRRESRAPRRGLSAGARLSLLEDPAATAVGVHGVRRGRARRSRSASRSRWAAGPAGALRAGAGLRSFGRASSGGGSGVRSTRRSHRAARSAGGLGARSGASGDGRRDGADGGACRTGAAGRCERGRRPALAQRGRLVDERLRARVEPREAQRRARPGPGARWAGSRPRAPRRA